MPPLIAPALAQRLEPLPFDQVLAQLRSSLTLPPELLPHLPAEAAAAVEVARGSVQPLRLAQLALGVRWRESRAGTAHGAHGSTGPSIVGEDTHGQGEDQFDDRAWPALAAAKGPNGLTILYSPVIEAVLCQQHLQRDLLRFGAEAPAVASYNAGPGAVAGALAAGKSVDSVTKGGDYSADVLRSVAAWWPNP